MNLASHGVSVLATISILAGGLFIGKGNLYAVVGAGLVVVAAPFDRSVYISVYVSFLVCVVCDDLENICTLEFQGPTGP